MRTPTKKASELTAADLAKGDLEVIGLLQGASNYTLLCKLTAFDETLVVYKPRRGEAPLWDFPAGTLCLREVAASVVCKMAGWDFVPLTILRDGPYGVGSVQVFFDHDPSVTAFDIIEEREEDLMRIALFDMVANNADRKAGHVFLDDDLAVRAIDHGVCFAEEPKLRTVLWDWVDEPIPSHLSAELSLLCDRLTTSQAALELESLLTSDEIGELRRRAEEVAGMKVFPSPGPGRPYPWPPI